MFLCPLAFVYALFKCEREREREDQLFSNDSDVSLWRHALASNLASIRPGQRALLFMALFLIVSLVGHYPVSCSE